MIYFMKPRTEQKADLLPMTPKNRTEIIRKGIKKIFLFEDKQVRYVNRETLFKMKWTVNIEVTKK